MNRFRKVFGESPVIIGMIQQSPDTYRLDGQNTLRFSFDMPEADDRFVQVEKLVQEWNQHAQRRLPFLRAPHAPPLHTSPFEPCSSPFYVYAYLPQLAVEAPPLIFLLVIPLQLALSQGASSAEALQHYLPYQPV